VSTYTFSNVTATIHRSDVCIECSNSEDELDSEYVDGQELVKENVLERIPLITATRRCGILNGMEAIHLPARNPDQSRSDIHINGFRYLPRQDGASTQIGQYEFYVSTDGVNWGSAVATDVLPTVRWRKRSCSPRRPVIHSFEGID